MRPNEDRGPQHIRDFPGFNKIDRWPLMSPKGSGNNDVEALFFQRFEKRNHVVLIVLAPFQNALL